MSDSLPSLFISHGSPMLALEDTPARRFLETLGSRRRKPRAVLMVSAHWEGQGGPEVSIAEKPATIHDFGGFPPALYALQYPAPGAPEAAAEAQRRLEAAGFMVRSSQRGLDHGAWVPLSLMYPSADVPVFQVSLIRGGGPEQHYRLGKALGELRGAGMLIIGSGSLTHNLRELGGQPVDAPPPRWVAEFASWVAEALMAGRLAELLDYRARAPFAVRNHPTEEHLLPLFVALGAGGEPAEVERVHSSTSYGILAMDAYAFSSPGGASAAY